MCKINEFLTSLVWTAALLGLRDISRLPYFDCRSKWALDRRAELDQLWVAIGSPGYPITAPWYADKAHGFSQGKSTGGRHERTNLVSRG